MPAHEISVSAENVIYPKTSENFEIAGFRGLLANGTSHVFSDTEFRTIHGMLERWGSTGLDEALAMDNFNRFYQIYPDMEMPADLKTYVFFTRPEMNLTGATASRTNPSVSISSENADDARLQYLAALNPELMYMLTSDYSADHQFIPYLQSRAESMQLPDYEIRTSEFTVPFYSYKFTYPVVTNESITGGTFTVTFREDSDLRITKLFQFWIYYMDSVMKNRMKPSRTHILDNSYDFMTSVYEIVTDPTSERILFWAKYTGCFPISVPISNLSHNLGSTSDSKISIQFAYMMVEAMEPRVLSDFNLNSPGTSGTLEDTYDTQFGVIGDSLVGNPRIMLTNDQHGLLLRWYTRKKGTTSIINKGATITSEANPYTTNTYINSSSGPAVTNAVPKTANPLSRYLQNNSDTIR